MMGVHLRYGIVVHGPEVIDTGRVQDLLDHFHRRGECKVCLGGAMGAIAVIDASLEDQVDITRRERVSDAMGRLGDGNDAVLILNHAKTRESGRAFGSILARRTSEMRCPLVQIDDGFVMALNREGDELTVELSRDLDLDVETIDLLESNGHKRMLNGVRPGENVWINGNVVGRATDREVTISFLEGELVFDGMEVKGPGLEKVIPFDLDKALIRSGSVRRTSASPRSIENGGNGKVMLIDHSAEDSFFETEDASAAVTVGDDTTRIAGNLLYRKGMPIVGITDGDEDGICGESNLAPGSVVIRLLPGNDDELGREVGRTIFGESRYAHLGESVDQLATRIIEMAGDRLMDIRRF
jgi:hypothetical protein